MTPTATAVAAPPPVRARGRGDGLEPDLPAAHASAGEVGPGPAHPGVRTLKPRNAATRLLLGPEDDPRWARPALWALLLATAALYLFNITNSGYANEFYAAAVKSSTQSWTAWLFGALDSGLSITVDKPPAALWVMGLSARLFGFSSASMLVPQALMGVGTVALTYGAVRRASGHAAGLIAGALAMLTPVAALMFRFNNPDALLVLCLTAAAYAVVRAIQTTRNAPALVWMAGAGWLIGLAFLTKMLQGLLVLPVLGLVYLLVAPRPVRTRLWHLLVATVSLIVSGGWLMVLAQLWPAASRPYIGGSTNNSLWELALGYNGLARIFGGAGNGGGGGMGGQNTGFGGTAGLLRMFNAAFGPEISWALPAALLLLVAGLIAAGRRPLGDPQRASLVLWGGSMLATAVVFSYMSGTVHPYYAVALAPLIGATAAIGGKLVWDRVQADGRFALVWRGVLALALAGTAAWGFYLMATYAASWLPVLRWTALIAGVGGALAYVLAGLFDGLTWRRIAAAGLIVGALGAAIPMASWTVATAASGHSGSIPTSGPAGVVTSGMGGGPGRDGGTMPGGPDGTTGTRSDGGTGTQTDGGPGGGASTSAELIALLDSAGTKWSAAVIGDQSAAGLILNTDTAVYCIGGWSGSDNNVTLEQFKQLVASGQIHYFIAGGQMGGGPGGGNGSSSASEISSWVTSTFKSTTVGNSTVYDLTQTA